jgi:hypothetical protein
VLRAEVREQLPWVFWRPAGRGLFEIDGVPAGVLRVFSRRRVKIEKRARGLAFSGPSSTRQPRVRARGEA